MNTKNKQLANELAEVWYRLVDVEDKIEKQADIDYDSFRNLRDGIDLITGVLQDMGYEFK